MNITIDRKVIEQALGALEQWNTPLYKRGHIITALRTALEQMEQEPVREVWCGCGDSIMPDSGAKCGNCLAAEARLPLTDDEIQAIWKKTFESGSSPNAFARAIEAAHGIKEYHMSERPLLFGFGAEKPSKPSPMEFISHHLIGGNPDDPDGYWDTQEKAIHFFNTEFLYILRRARHKYLFVRTAPELFSSYDGKGWRMVGRFSIAQLKE